MIGVQGCRKIPEEQMPIQSDKTKSKVVRTSAAAGDEFTVVVIPDTQYYMEVNPDVPGATFEMFKAQIDWIKANQAAENIVFVAGVGDIVDNGDFKAGTYPDSSVSRAEWEKAKYYYNLETPFAGFPDGIPYGLAVGNHDQTGHGYPISYDNFSLGFHTTHTTGFYNKYFGVSHFAGRSYYGGSYTATEANNNDNHYSLFSAGGIDFIVIFLEYDEAANQYSTALEDWAHSLLGTYSSRKAIIVMHALGRPNGTPGSNLGTPSIFYPRAQAVYNRIRSRPNVFLMLGGHTGGSGEGFRQDTYGGKTIKSITSNYQGQTNGGNGYLRLMKFSVANDLISIKSYSPYLNQYKTDGDSQFLRTLFHEPTATRTFDFNHDGKSQIGFYEDGFWKIDGSPVTEYGLADRIPVPADYDGDGDADLGTFNGSTGNWAINNLPYFNFGSSGDIPVQGDYNGDGRADVAVFRPSNSTWYVQGGITEQFGLSTYIPVPGDYNGDGKVDIAVFNPSGRWHVKDIMSDVEYGTTGYIPVPGDYNGDGKTDIAVFSPGSGTWHLNGKAPNVVVVTPAAGDVPVPGDYFGDGKTHPAIFRPSNKTLYQYNGSVITKTLTSPHAAKDILNLPYHIRKFFFP